MDEKKTELIYSVFTAITVIFGACKGMLPAETVAWIVFGLAIAYMVLRTGLKIAKAYAAATPSPKDDAYVAALEALADRLKIPLDPELPPAPKKAADQSPAKPAAPPVA